MSFTKKKRRTDIGEFMAWILGTRSSSPASEASDIHIADEGVRAPKQFLIIGNQNAITYKEVFQ